MKTTAVNGYAPLLHGRPESSIVHMPLRFPTTTTREVGNAAGLHLTPRQLEVLSLLGEGLPNKLICRRLNISTGTVKIHISCILRELGVTSRLQAVVSAQRCGLLVEPTPASAEHSRDPARARQLEMTA